MIQEEQYLEEAIGRKDGFRVPEGYFNQLTASVMSQLPERKARTKVLYSWLYAAACIIAVAVMSVTYYMHQQSTDDMTADSNYYEEAADYAMLDNMDIYACMVDE